jgi:single-strand DNA-binding protein
VNNLNQILIEGNLTRDPDLKHTKTGKAVCTFSIACNRYTKKGDEFEKAVSFFDVTAWTELAENCAKELKKGRGVRVIGRLEQDRWQDQDGKQRSKIYVVAEHVVFKPEGQKKEEVKEEPLYEDDIPF